MTYVIRYQWERDGKRCSQFVEIMAADRDDAECQLAALANAKLCGTLAHMNEMAKRGRHPNEEEMKWAIRRATDLGLIKTESATLGTSINFDVKEYRKITPVWSSEGK